jgi:hypothetical protein
MESALFNASPPFNDQAPLSPETSQFPQQPFSSSDPSILPAPVVTSDNGISPAEFMALLNDSNAGFDMGAMFHPGMIHHPQQSHQQHSGGNLSPTFLGMTNGIGVLASP